MKKKSIHILGSVGVAVLLASCASGPSQQDLDAEFGHPWRHQRRRADQADPVLHLAQEEDVRPGDGAGPKTKKGKSQEVSGG